MFYAKELFERGRQQFLLGIFVCVPSSDFWRSGQHHGLYCNFKIIYLYLTYLSLHVLRSSCANGSPLCFFKNFQDPKVNVEQNYFSYVTKGKLRSSLGRQNWKHKFQRNFTTFLIVTFFTWNNLGRHTCIKQKLCKITKLFKWFQDLGNSSLK